MGEHHWCIVFLLLVHWSGLTHCRNRSLLLVEGELAQALLQ